MDQFTIKDLPEIKDERASYKLSGKTLKAIFGLIQRLWSGDNILCGPGLLKSGNSGAGLVISSRKILTRSQFNPFQLIETSTGGDNPEPRIRVVYSTIKGEEPNGFSPGDDPVYLLTPEGTSGFVWGGITINESTGEIVDNGVFLDIGEEVPFNTNDTFYILIGIYVVNDGVLSAVNARYGPIDATICRNWFASEAPFYGVNWS